MKRGLTLASALVCGLLAGIVIGSGAGSAQTQAPPAATPPPAVAVPPPAPSPDETIVALKGAIIEKDYQYAQVLANFSQCRAQLLDIERANLNAKKKPAEPQKPVDATKPAQPAKP